MKTKVVALSLMLALSCTACTGYKPNDPYAKTVVVGEAETKLGHWFRCDECMGGQLRRVQELGDTVVPALADNLRGTVPNVGLHKNMYKDRCIRLNARIAGRGLDPLDCDDYADRFERQLVKRYESRALEALLAIRTYHSCTVIESETDRNLCKVIPPFPPVRELLETDRSLHDPRR